MGTDIHNVVRELRRPPLEAEQVLRALSAVATIWQRRLETDWQPPDSSSFPWSHVRVSLAALLPGLATAGDWLTRARAEVGSSETSGRVAGLILAGNTPLMSWSPLCACLLGGFSVFVKMSREETLWPRLFVESLVEVDRDLAEQIHLDVWPGDDSRTGELVQSVDAVIAFGGDTTIGSLRNETPENTPFFGYGHSISVAVAGSTLVTDEALRGLARDVLLYRQGGCLSPQYLFLPKDMDTGSLAERLATFLTQEADALETMPVTDPTVAHAVRTAIDLANFAGHRVFADAPGLRFAVIVHEEPDSPLPPPTGNSILPIVPVDDGQLLTVLQPLDGMLSSIGVLGEETDEIRATGQILGVSRLCPVGTMQAPPLDWPNNNYDLLSALLKL